VPLINTICFENSSLYLGLYQMWVPCLGQLRVVKFRNTLGAKGYNGFHSIYFLLVHIALYGGEKIEAKLENVPTMNIPECCFVLLNCSHL
jgi:hypothetical protein